MSCLSNLYLAKHTQVLTVFTILLSFIVVGCATKAKMYPGDQVEASKQVVIRVYEPTKEELAYIPNEELHERKSVIRITKVDDSFTTYLFMFNYIDGVEEVTVLPGKHRLKVKEYWRGGMWEGRSNLWLVTEPGEKYIIKSIAKHMRVSTWIENERTGQLVGGIVGSDDEPKQ